MNLQFRSLRRLFNAEMDAIGASSRSGSDWKINAAILVDAQADKGDPMMSRLRSELAPAGRESEQYRNGVEAFFHTMGRSGDFHRALYDANYTAGVLPPPEDTHAQRRTSRHQSRIMTWLAGKE